MRGLWPKGDHIRSIILLLCVFLISPTQCQKKHRYASLEECDRHSLDAIYHDKYKPITNNIFSDIKEFVSRVTDSMADSLTNIMAQLPDRDTSDDEERKIHSQFTTVKKAFASRLKKTHRNLTEAWETLLHHHFHLMYDTGNVTLEQYLNLTLRLTDSYSQARTNLDAYTATVIGFVKGTVKDGLRGITMAAEMAIKEDAKKKNDTKEEDPGGQKESKENVLKKKKLEIAEMITSGFLGNVTLEVIKRGLDLDRKITTKPEDRDSVLDDVEFDMLMIKNRIRALVETDLPRDKGGIDLVRRSIYTYWADMAENMYRDILEAASTKSTSGGGRAFYRKLWDDDAQLMETLLDLMDIYP